MTYRNRLILTVCGLVLVTGGVVLWIVQSQARASAHAMATSLLEEASRHAVTHAEAFVSRAGPVVETLTGMASSRGVELVDGGWEVSADDLGPKVRDLLAALKANPGLTWLSWAAADGSFLGVYRTPAEERLRINQSWMDGGKTRLLEWEHGTDGRWQVVRDEEDSGYDPRVRSFYRAAAASDQLVWLPPYRFYGESFPGVTCAKAVRSDEGAVLGVFTADFDLFALSRFVAGLHVSEKSRAFLFTQDGTLIAYPKRLDLEVLANRLPTLADVDETVVKAYRENLPQVNAADASTVGFVPFEFTHDGARHLASATFFPIGNQWWAVGIAAPESDFMAGVWRGQRWAMLAAGLAVLGALALAMLMARRVSRPVVAMMAFMDRVGRGDLEARADFGGDREFRDVAAALNQMVADVRDRLRLRHSLEVASQVQQRLLPASLPRIGGLDVAGHSTYCDETGGDYYDFVLLEESDNEQLLIALGDVMGHGIAAALVMAGARAVLRDRAGEAGSLADLMNRLNEMLATDLGGSRFMTMHLSTLNAAEGRFRWVSAGHDPPILYDPGSDTFVELDGGDLPLGVAGDTQYVEYLHQPLQAGQVIFVGTDGIWEMQNAAGEQFAKHRLQSVIRAAASRSAAEIGNLLTEKLSAFRGPQPSLDDVTFVVVKLETSRPQGSQGERS